MQYRVIWRVYGLETGRVYTHASEAYDIGDVEAAKRWIAEEYAQCNFLNVGDWRLVPDAEDFDPMHHGADFPA
jgi:hypothetical protein